MQQQVLLRKKYTVWLNIATSGVVDRTTFQDSLVEVSAIETAAQFWTVFNNLQKPESMPDGAQVLIFVHGIHPIWEDKANVDGGRFVVRAKKGFGNKIWEDLLLSYVLDESDECVCGLVAHTKKTYT